MYLEQVWEKIQKLSGPFFVFCFLGECCRVEVSKDYKSLGLREESLA